MPKNRWYVPTEAKLEKCKLTVAYLKTQLIL